MSVQFLLLNGSRSLKEAGQLIRALELQAKWSAVPLVPGEEIAALEAALRHRDEAALK